MAFKFCSIASGSSGNSIYVGNNNTHILIDAGLSGKKVQQGLKDIDVAGEDINAIFITHEHSDHIKGAGILSRRFNIPIYATAGTWAGMEGQLGDISQENKKVIVKGQECVVEDLCVRAYEIPHDANEPVGYNIMSDRFKVTVATDIGHITDTLIDNIKGSDALLLEANHDINMLKVGSYPYYLKQRILGDYGHLSNESSAELLCKVVDSKLKHVLLGHLSQENNFPELAFETVAGILKANGIQLGTYLNMGMAPRSQCSQVIRDGSF
jgi:phosphoribosyl 1,2-cyclic phosphodiesterase